MSSSTPASIPVTPATATPSSSTDQGRNKSRSLPSFTKTEPVMVTILVGPNKNKFVVHQDFLTYHSPYFAGCLEGSFGEAATKVVNLDHTSVEAFGLFVQWIYTQDITQAPSNSKKSTKPLVNLWILADYLQVPRLQNAAMDALFEIRTTPICSGIQIYDSTTVESPLRKYLVDKCVWELNGAWFKKHPLDFSHEMLIDLVTAFKEKINIPLSPLKERSKYYVKVEDKQQDD